MARTNEEYLISAEYQALKILATTPDVSVDEIDPDWFPHKTARSVFLSIRSLREAKESVNETSLLREANKIDDNVTATTIRTILSAGADLSNYVKALATLKEGSIKHRLNKAMDALTELTTSPEFLDVDTVSSALYDMQTAVREGGGKKKAKTLEQLTDAYVEELLKRKDGKYFYFGDYFLDKTLLRRAAPGQVVLITATTGSGKSTYVLNLIDGMINMNNPCMYFSLEMDEISTMDRLLSHRTQIPTRDWYSTGPEIDKLIAKVEEERKVLENKPFQLIDDPAVSLDNIVRLIQDFKATYKTPYVCVFIDLITMVKEFSLTTGGTLATQIEFSINRLNAIAKNEGVCFVCVAQLNRETDKEKIDCIEDIKKYRPTLTQIKNSNALGERSRVVLSVFRPKYYAERLFPDDPATESLEDVLQVQVLKQSQDMVGNIGYYIFDGPCFTVRLKEGDSEE